MPKFSRPLLGAVTALTMAIATFPQVVFGVLAAELIAAFDVARWQIGILVTATGVTGAVLSPALGRITDRVGAVNSTRGTLLSALVTLGLIGISPSYTMLALSALLSGAPQGWSNPATNALLVESLPKGGRGAMTGVKQSGVQVGIFLGGLLLPVLASLWGWRIAVGAFLTIPLIGLLGMVGKRDPEREAATHRSRSEAVPLLIQWVAVYGILSGLGTSAMLTFLPLFAEEDQLWSGLHSGWLLAGVGLVGIAARIFWGITSESWLGHGRTLGLLALLTGMSSLILALAAAGILNSAVLLVAGFLLSIGGVAWNTVGMLTVMDHSPKRQVGRGTGRVLLGFLLGYGIGAPLMGFSVDQFGSYAPGWIGVTLLFLAATFVASRVGRLIPDAAAMA